MFCKILHWSLTSCLLFSTVAAAEVYIHDTRTWRRAKMISSGQQVWAFQSSYQKATDRFSDSREVQPLGRPYGRTVTWRNLLQAEASVEARSELESYMRARGIRRDDIAATSEYELEREEVGFSVDWAYGLTSNWMIGFQVPIVYRQTRVSADVQLTPELAQGVGQAGQKSMLALSRGDLREKVRGLAESELANSGYDAIPDEQESWEVGDISLLSQQALLSRADWRWSVQQMVRFPTARNPSVADYFQSSTDEGQVDLGLTSLMDYRKRRWTLGMRLGYVAQLPDSAKMRVLTDGEDSNIDPNVQRDLGDWVWGALDTEYRLTNRMDFNLEYAFLAKGQDRYEGESFAGTSYDVLAENTAQELHQTRLGMLYRLGTRTARSGVENKWVASLGYTYPWLGRNSIDASRTTLEIITYF